MRHQLSGRQLSRNSSHRRALMRNMCASRCIRAETIRTTLPKAKELRRVVEPLITLGKNGLAAGRRRAWSTLARRRAGREAVRATSAPRFKSRAGGYTRILKMGPRPGDIGADGADAARRGRGRAGRLPPEDKPAKKKEGRAEEGRSAAEEGRAEGRQARPRRSGARRPQAERFPNRRATRAPAVAMEKPGTSPAFFCRLIKATSPSNCR